eukprot:TRINITY_DN19632_c0_g1_i1.p1 TRINITY_DN19632_c0_g1~~TRINITY_DN19632_c0_g1_i1.p1  ORF type:complete len:316 (-),score=29.84 TRINITY_DN19632_c0_g1_i1:443-1390(-)
MGKKRKRNGQHSASAQEVLTRMNLLVSKRTKIERNDWLWERTVRSAKDETTEEGTLGSKKSDLNPSEMILSEYWRFQLLACLLQSNSELNDLLQAFSKAVLAEEPSRKQRGRPSIVRPSPMTSPAQGTHPQVANGAVDLLTVPPTLSEKKSQFRIGGLSLPSAPFPRGQVLEDSVQGRIRVSLQVGKEASSVHTFSELYSVQNEGQMSSDDRFCRARLLPQNSWKLPDGKVIPREAFTARTKIMYSVFRHLAGRNNCFQLCLEERKSSEEVWWDSVGKWLRSMDNDRKKGLADALSYIKAYMKKETITVHASKTS